MILNIKPKACPRPRVTRSGRVYYPIGYKEWIKDCRDQLEEMDIPSGALHIEIVFVFHRPKRLKRYGDRVIHDKRPDLDNCVKSVLDALPIKDDCRVSSIYARKYYAAWNEEPCIEITIDAHK